MLTLNKLKPLVQRQLKLQVFEIAVIGILLGLWSISALPALTINLGFMRIGVTYVWPILLGLMARPLWAAMASLLGDTLALAINGTGFSQWMVEYALVYPGIALVTALLKWVLFNKAAHYSLMICGVLNALAFGALVAILSWRENFVNSATNNESFFSFTSVAAKAITWSVLALLVAFSLAGASFIFFTRHSLNNVRQQKRLAVQKYWSIYTIVLVILIIFVWVWGPFAQIRYLNAWVNPSRNYYATYDLFLIPRVLKTPFSLALYTLIIAPLYQAYKIVNQRRSHAASWVAEAN